MASKYLAKAAAASPPSQSSAAAPNAPLDVPIKSSMADYPGMMTIISEFVDGLPRQVRDMTNFIDRNDIASLRRAVHQLRGAGGGYGFMPLTDLAIDAEGSLDPTRNVKSSTAEVAALIDVIRRVEGYDESKAVLA